MVAGWLRVHGNYKEFTGRGAPLGFVSKFVRLITLCNFCTRPFLRNELHDCRDCGESSILRTVFEEIFLVAPSLPFSFYASRQ